MTTNGGGVRVEPEVVEAIRRVLGERLQDLGFREARVYPGEDHDGEPVLFIEAHYGLREAPVDVTPTFGLHRALREALAEVGETRFPHVRHRFDERQRVARSH
jgi:hypothetical protein